MTTKNGKKIPPKLNYRQALKNTVILTSTVIIDISKIDNAICIMLRKVELYKFTNN